MSKFYAVSSLGYGQGETLDEAKANYYDVQMSNFPAVAKTDAGRRKWVEENLPPVLLAVPVGATGIRVDGGVIRWVMKDDGVRRAEESDIASQT